MVLTIVAMKQVLILLNMHHVPSSSKPNETDFFMEDDDAGLESIRLGMPLMDDKLDDDFLSGLPRLRGMEVRSLLLPFLFICLVVNIATKMR